MSRFRSFLTTLGVFALCTLAVSAAEPLKKGDRIVFLGDSITQGGVSPDGYVTVFSKMVAAGHADLGIQVIGAGISGNKVPDLERRLDKDVIEKKPTIVVIYIGINDVWHSQSGKGTPADAYEKGLRSLIERIRAAGARPVLCTASVIGEKHDGSNPLDKMLDEYCAISRTVAESTKTQLIDLRKAFLDHLKANNKANADRGILTGDIVHLNKAGNAFVAKQMAEGLGVTIPKHFGKKLRHVVCFKFKPEVTPEQVKEVTDAFAQLPKKISGIDEFEWGTNNSPEGLADGYTHCFLVTFKDEETRKAYLPHPQHEEFVGLVKPRLAGVFVIDYWTE